MTFADPVADFNVRLAGLESDARIRFNALRTANRVDGLFEGDVWHCANVALKFCSPSAPHEAIAGPLAVLARCFMVVSIESRLSHGAIYGRLQAVRWIYHGLGSDIRKFMAITKADLNRVVSKAKEQRSPATVYNRANGIAMFAQYLDDTRIGHGVEAVSLLGRRLNWKTNLKNPIRRSIEIDSDEDRAPHRKYQPSLHKALGSARSRIRTDPSLEPTPGHDLVRLESLAFAMATGMRIGELCALPIDCYDVEEATGTPYLRVATEKGQHASARPVADIWAPAVADAYDYLLEQCAGPRQRALEIESRGFEFVRDRLAAHRIEAPADEALMIQLEVTGLDADDHYRIDEVAAALDISPKELTIGGRFYESTVNLPRIVAARLVRWVDQRISAWDWSSFARRPDARTGQVGSRHLSASEVADRIGGGGACLAKADWIYEEFRQFLVLVSACGALERDGVDADAKERIKVAWSQVKSKALSRSGGGQCTAVHVETLQQLCAAKYKSYLQNHYRESVSLDEDGAPSLAAAVRPGVPERLSEHLIVIWENAFAPTRSRSLLPRPIFRSDYYNYLSSNAQKRTVFERLQICDETGALFSITPHQIRHWVTTAIFRSGPSEAMVDLWMGRSPGQSRVYDHRTARERAEAFRERYLVDAPPDDYLGRRVKLWRENGVGPEIIEHHLASKLRVMHFVPTGACSRELFLSPCTKGLMCLRGFGTDSACPSFHVDTSDENAKANIVALRDQYQAMMSALYPTASQLADVMREELNSTKALDQHIFHIREVLRGCEQALAAYHMRETSTVRAVAIPLEML
jgi:integrase